MRLDPKLTRIAVPTKGRLQEASAALLQAAGIRFQRRARSLFAPVHGLPMAVLFLRPDDIPVLVAEGAADLGMVGRDLVCEHGCGKRVRERLELDFGHCRLAVAVRESSGIRSVRALHGKKVAATMVHSATAFFRRRKIKAQVVPVSGSVEVMVALGMADAIVDLVETGETLRDNGLRVLETIFSSQAVLISGKKLRDAKLCDLVTRRIRGVLTARQYTLLEYNIRRDRLKKAERIAPGFDSPTISELEDPKWCAVKVMIPKKRSIEIIDKLEALGASAILETEILNCRL